MSDQFHPEPLTLTGEVVQLEPLAVGHAEDLFRASADPELWRYMPRGAFADVDDVREWIRGAGVARESGSEIPFAIVEVASGTAVGSTRYLDIRRADRALEIGWTWLARSHQRTAVNTECKYLLLRHAFETLGAIRVQLKTDRRNVQSQRAIERIGAVREGVLRRQRVLWDGFVRDTVYYSILAEEWPRVKGELERRLAAG